MNVGTTLLSITGCMLVTTSSCSYGKRHDSTSQKTENSSSPRRNLNYTFTATAICS